MKYMVTAILTGALLITGSAVQADRWYNNKYVWGAGGLATGIVVADAYHRHYRPSNERCVVVQDRVHTSYGRNHQWDDKTQIGPYYRQVDYATPRGGVYTKEVGVWPFYKKRESYAVVLNDADPNASQSSSVVGIYGNREKPAEKKNESSVSINLGDNNENVSINVTTPDSSVKASEKTVSAPIPNTGMNTEGRVVDK